VISTGDSKEPADTTSKIEGNNVIKRVFLDFAKVLWKVDLEWKGNSLPLQRQHDNSSCGPCTINFLEQLVCKDVDPWTPRGLMIIRSTYFIKWHSILLNDSEFNSIDFGHMDADTNNPLC